MDWLGWWPVLLWVGLTFVFGLVMLRQYRLAFAMTLMRDLQQGKFGAGSLFALARYSIAAILLLLPGLGGDVAGLLLLLPWRFAPAPVVAPPQDDTLEGEYRRVDPDQQRLEDRER